MSNYYPGHQQQQQQQQYYAPPQGPPPNFQYANENNGYAPPSVPYPYQPPPGFPPPAQDRNAPPPVISRGGARKAVLIGINYVGSSCALQGCHNDAINMSKFISERYGYRMSDVVVLMDSPGVGPGSSSYPSRSNMIQAMQWLVRDAYPGDTLFFHYSGHGGQTQDFDGDQQSGLDDTILPADFQSAGEIISDDLHKIMVAPLCRGVRLTAIFDSCHSASSMQLPYVFSTAGKIKEPNLAKEFGQSGMTALSSYARGDYGGVLSSLTSFAHHATNDNRILQQNRVTKTSEADVISFSGCKDSQTSADAADDFGRASGAMSWAFVAALTQYPQQSYVQLLNMIRNQLSAKNFTQKPQICCSHDLDCNLLVII